MYDLALVKCMWFFDDPNCLSRSPKFFERQRRSNTIQYLKITSVENYLQIRQYIEVERKCS